MLKSENSKEFCNRKLSFYIGGRIMWPEIILSLSLAVGEAICTEILEKKKKNELHKELHKIIEKNFDCFKNSPLNTGEMHYLITSRQFIELLRNYYFTLYDGVGNKDYCNNIVIYICKRCKNIKEDEVNKFVERIESTYNNYLMNIIEKNTQLYALFQILTISHRAIIQKITESEENILNYMESLNREDIAITDEVIDKYHEICNLAYSKIRFTGISVAEKKELQCLDDFYVENTFSYYNKEIKQFCNQDDDMLLNLSINNYFDYCNKIVLLGAAGLGKSTTLNYIFCNYEKLFEEKVVKIKIDLKEYAGHICEKKFSILECLCDEFLRRVPRNMIDKKSSEKLIAKYLDDGKCLIILDALDEIPNQSKRNKVRDAVENFCNIYYMNRFIITSREAGYLRNRFDDSFIHIRINNFTDDQIKEYSRKWRSKNLSQRSFDEFWEKFNEEIEKSKCRELVRNPIVLILALVVFDIEKNLPNQRVEFYKKCIETFLIIREDRKDAFDMNEKIKGILGDDLVVPRIAFYKFENIIEVVDYKFTRKELETSILKAIDVTDERNWFEPVKEYTKYLVDRTELIREIDEDSYDFAHKTFYEYFLAVYYSRTLETKQLIEQLNSWIGDSNFDELARLIIEVIIDKNDLKQHKDIIEFLFKNIEQIKIQNEKDKGCKTEENYQNKKNNKYDMIYILVELYNCNMLQPKFHSRYNDFILRNAELVSNYYPLRPIFYKNRNRFTVKYDCKVLAEIFLDIYSKNNQEKYVIINTLFFLDQPFKDQLLEENDLFINNVYELFLRSSSQKMVLQNDESKAIVEADKLIKLRSYFMVEKMDYVNNSPEIFLSLLKICVDLGDYVDFDSCISFQFKPNTLFTKFLGPIDLCRLFLNCFDSPESFLALISSILQCAKGRVNYLLVYLFNCSDGKLRSLIGKLSEAEMIQAKENCFQIASLFYESLDYDIFYRKINSMNVYNKNFNDLYKSQFEDYKKREMKLERRNIEKLLKNEMRFINENINPPAVMERIV